MAETRTHDGPDGGPRTALEEVRRIAADTGFAMRLATGRVQLPEPTPTDGPDPYGNPDPEWLKIDWRRHLRTVDVVGAEANYVEMGEGPPLVFVHGLSGAWQNWLEQIPRLSQKHRVIAMDLPGFGASPMPPWEIAIPAYGTFVRDFCEKLRRRSLRAGRQLDGRLHRDRGRDLGSRSHRQARARFRRRDHLGARAAGAGGGARADGPCRRRRMRSSSRWRGSSAPDCASGAFQGIFFDPNALRREVLWENIVPALQSPGYYDAMTTLVGYDIRDRLEEIEVPTLIVWGRNDRVVPIPAAFAYQERIGDNARLEIFDHCGHVPQMERPVRFNRLLEEFLGRAGSETVAVRRRRSRFSL